MSATLVDLPGEPALDHRDEPLGAHVGAGADGAGAAQEHEREQERVRPAEDGEPVDGVGAPEELERVVVEAGRGLLDPGEVRRARELVQVPRAQVPTGSGGDVVDDERHGAHLGHCLEVSDDPGLRRTHVVRHHDQRRDERRRTRQLLPSLTRRSGVVRAGTDDELR